MFLDLRLVFLVCLPLAWSWGGPPCPVTHLNFGTNFFDLWTAGSAERRYPRKDETDNWASEVQAYFILWLLADEWGIHKKEDLGVFVIFF